MSIMPFTILPPMQAQYEAQNEQYNYCSSNGRPMYFRQDAHVFIPSMLLYLQTFVNWERYGLPKQSIALQIAQIQDCLHHC